MNVEINNEIFITILSEILFGPKTQSSECDIPSKIYIWFVVPNLKFIWTGQGGPGHLSKLPVSSKKRFNIFTPSIKIDKP